jgi:hypothetical protein
MREQHTILNIYELPSIEQTIRYLHASAGFPTKTTWLAAIQHRNYDTWPLVSSQRTQAFSTVGRNTARAQA